MNSEVFFEITVIFALAFVNGLFAMAELALVSSSKARLQAESKRGKKTAALALALATDPNSFLATVQIGITLIGIGSGVFGGALIASTLQKLLSPLPWIGQHSELVSFIIVISIITFLSLVFGELVPKRLALSFPEKIATLMSPLVYTVSKIFRPLVWVLERATRLVLRVLPLPVQPQGFISQEELNEALIEGTRSGLIEEEEKEIVHKVFRLGDRPIWTIMTNRVDLVTVTISDSIDVSLGKTKATGHLVYPALDDEGNVLGLITGQDLYAVKFDHKELQSALRPAPLVPRSVSALALLRRLKESGQDVAIVIDEYGAVEGLITTHDLLEAMVGEIGEDAPNLLRREDGSYLIDAAMDLSDVFKELGIPDDVDLRRYHSLAGFLINELNTMPKTGSLVTRHGWKFEVVDMDGRRIDKVLASKLSSSHLIEGASKPV